MVHGGQHLLQLCIPHLLNPSACLLSLCLQCTSATQADSQCISNDDCIAMRPLTGHQNAILHIMLRCRLA